MVPFRRIRQALAILLAALCGQNGCGGVVTSTGGGDGAPDACVADCRIASTDSGRNASDAPQTHDSEDDTEGASPDGGACGALGQTCCAGDVCAGTLPCIAGRCSCNTSADCPAHGTCRSDNRCLMTLAGDQFYPAALAVRASEVYWVDEATTAKDFGSVVKIGVAGGSPITLASHQSTPNSLAVDAEHVYWVNPTGLFDGGSLVRVSIRGGTPTTIVAAPNSASEYLWGGVAVDTEDVYWLTSGGSGPGQIMHVPKTGGTPSALVSGLARPTALALDATTAYFTTGQDVGLVALSGGAPRTFSTGYYGQMLSIAADDERVYWVNTASVNPSANGVVQAMPKGGGPVTTLASMEYEPSGVATDGAAVYFTVNSASAGAIMTVPVAGGAPFTLVAGENNADAIAVDDTSVYWSTYSNFGAVRRLTPK